MCVLQVIDVEEWVDIFQKIVIFSYIYLQRDQGGEKGLFLSIVHLKELNYTLPILLIHPNILSRTEARAKCEL